jgi:NADH-quinone oxidoreductase subunit L
VAWPVRAARAELYGNEINEGLVVRPGGHLVTGLTYFDDHVVDGVVEGTALGVGGTGSILRVVQTGFVRSYALSLLAGAVLVVAALLAVNLA